MLHSIQNLLPPGHPWRHRLIWLDTIDSTNTYAKTLARQGAEEGTMVFANAQTGGRGRLGRSFSSPAGAGLYFSLILRPNCPAQKLMHLTCATGVAVSDAIMASSAIQPGIKWTNDLVLGKKKLGGILTELSVNPETALVDWVIVGVGINCTQQQEDFPPEIRNIATSLSMALNRQPDKASIAAALVDSLHRMSQNLFIRQEEIMDQFSRRCVTIGQAISIVRGEEIRHARAVGVDLNGGLQVMDTDGQLDTITSGEVSIRGMYGYV